MGLRLTHRLPRPLKQPNTFILQLLAKLSALTPSLFPHRSSAKACRYSVSSKSNLVLFHISPFQLILFHFSLFFTVPTRICLGELVLNLFRCFSALESALRAMVLNWLGVSKYFTSSFQVREARVL